MLAIAAVGFAALSAGSGLAASGDTGATSVQISGPPRLDEPHPYGPPPLAKAREGGTKAPVTDTPRAEAERERSQTAYVNADRAGSEALMQGTFAEEAPLVAEDPTQTPDPANVESYIGDRAARIDPPGPKRPYVLTSTYPLRVRNDAGRLKPLDFELQRDGDSYVPGNVAEDVSLPADPSGFIRLPGVDVGIKLHLADARDAKTDVIEDEQHEKSKLFVHDIAADTDALTTPSLGGAEQLLQLRSPDAPTTISYAVSMRPDDQLRQAGQGEGELQVIRDGEPIARVTAPSAIDAQGSEVPVSLKPTADGFELLVNHAGRDLAWPLLVDPGFDYVSTPSNWGYGSWYIETSPGAIYSATPCLHYCWGPGFYMSAGAGYTVGAGSYAQYHLVPPGSTTFIDQAFFENVNFARGGDNGSDQPYLYAGLSEPGYGDFWTWGSGATGSSYLAEASGEGLRNGAYIGMGTTVTRTLPTHRDGDVGVVHLHLEDPESPSVGQPSAPGGWITSNSQFNVAVPASDPGLGVVAAHVYAPDDKQGQKRFGAFASGCGSSPPNQVCPNSTSVQVPVDPANVPDGIQTLRAIATDAGGTNTGWIEDIDDPTAPFVDGAQTTTVKLDRAGPKIDLSGPLYEARDADLGQTSYPMHIAAIDGTTDPGGAPESHRSGVKKVQVYVDNHQQEFISPDLSCPQDSCPLELDVDSNTPGIQDWTLNAAQLGGGVHPVTVVATDQVGNTTTKTLDMTVNGLAGVIITPKSGDSTARLFGLTAERHDPTMTDVTFQFRRSGTTSWQAIPTAQLTLDSDGSHPASTLLHLDQNGKSPPLTWDVPPTPGIDGIDGQINIRARFSSGSPVAQATDNAALFWRLGESDGTRANDSSGNDRHGSYVGNPLMNQHGAPIGNADDGAVDLNGTSQYVTSNWPTRHNLVTNPSIETDMSGWGAWFSPTGSVTRTTSQAQTGTASLKAAAQPQGQGVVYGITASAGKYYSGAAQLRGGAAPGRDVNGLNLYLCYLNSSLQAIRCDPVNVNASAGWTRAVNNGSAFGPAPAGTIGVWLIVTNGSSTAQDFYVDSAQLEEISTIDPYFDGSSPGAHWEGTAQNSVSAMDGAFSNGVAHTYEGWAYRDTNSTADVLFGGSSLSNAPRLKLEPGTQDVTWRTDGGTSGVATTKTWTNAWPANNQWVHWALVFNEPADTVSLYINGTLVSTKADTDKFSGSAGSFMAGARATIPDYFDGKLDEVAVYEGSLSASEITGLATNSPQKGFSQVVPVTLSRDDTTSKHVSAPVGPGSVDLLTGNFGVSADDVSVDSWSSDLTVSRTFNSRQASYGPGPFGPGWIASDPVDSAASDYISLTFQGGIAKLNESDGTTITFSKNAAGDWVAEPGYEDLKLEASGSNYTVSDLDGNVTTLSQVQGSADYKPVAVKQPGQPNATTFNWDTISGRQVIRREIAAVPAGVSCPGYPSSLKKGCRALDFVYASSTTASGNGTNQAQWGDFVGQVKEIDFVYGTSQSGGGQQVVPVAKYQYDSDGRLRGEWDPRISPALKTTYDYDSGGRLLHVNPPGLNGWTLAYRAPAANDNAPGKGGRLASASRSTPNGTATTTVGYGIPLTGGSTPYQMGASNVSAWGQTDVPTDATAVFPADTAPSDPPSSSQIGLATVYYMNRNGDAVNVASPGGEITTTEYEEHHLVKRTLTAANRVRVLADPSLIYKIDSQNIYGADGLELLQSYGPLHAVKLSDGTTANARQHTVTAYDQGAPPLQHPHLATTTVTGARVDGESSDRDPQTTTTDYNWKLRLPTTTTADPGGLNLTTKSSYDDSTGLQVQSRSPKANASGTDAHTTNTIYYTAGTNSQDAGCGDKAEWANLPCKIAPAAQPGGSLPNLPATRYASYNIWDQPTAVVETVPGSGEQRTTATTYDGAGRTLTTSVTATGTNPGTSLPTRTYGYDASTGLPTTVSDGTRTLTKQYDTIGRLAYYTDADSNTSTTNYDILNRPTSFNDGKGTTTYAYDATTRRLSSETDSAVGQITASYDADGNVTSEALPAGPNKLVMTISYDAAGNAIQKKYDLCTLGNCSLAPTNRYSDAIYLSTHDQIQQETTSIDASTYGYDAAGRLTKAGETVGSQCATRRYSYDADSNRAQLETNVALGSGFCAPTGTSQTTQHTYDDADRTTDSGYSYDAFGRTLTVPALDAGGSQLSSTYYVDDRARTLTQAGVTQTFNLDPAERIRLQSTSGKPDQTFHYANDSDNPAWINLGGAQSNWERFIGDPAGDLCATQVGHGSTSDGFTYQLTDLHGDVAMTVNSDGSAAGSFNTDEFGTPEGAVPADGHGWLGGKGRITELGSGVIAMGQRVYLPEVGRFLQTDPIPGGSANDYDYVSQDPINAWDLDGTRRRKIRRRQSSPPPTCTGPPPSQVILSGGALEASGTVNCTSPGSLYFTKIKVKMCIQQKGLPGKDNVNCNTKVFHDIQHITVLIGVGARCSDGNHTYRAKIHVTFIQSNRRLPVYKQPGVSTGVPISC